MITALNIIEYRAALFSLASERKDWIFSREGWPWELDSSTSTDYVYIFDMKKGKVLCTKDPNGEEVYLNLDFPSNMKSKYPRA